MKLFNRRPVMAFENYRKPEVGIIRHRFARFYFWLTGWQMIGYSQEGNKGVIVFGYHTSNWDTWNMIMAGWLLRLDVRFLVKIEWTRIPIIGLLVRAMGGIGIDRANSQDTADWIINQFKTREHFVLAIAPEGTRKKTDHWHIGFYLIAYGANVPMKLALLDYGTKRIDLTPPVMHPTGDMEADIEKIWGYFRTIRGLHPEKQSDLRLRPSAIRLYKSMLKKQNETLKDEHPS